MHAQFIQLKDPFRPTINREVGVAIPGRSVRRTLKTKKLTINGRRVAPFVVTINGTVVLEKDWNLKVHDNDIIVVQHLPAHGGGSNPLQIIAMVALVVASAYTGGAAGAAFGAAWGAAAQAAVMIGGSILLNMMFKQNTPGVGAATNSSASPTYTLSAQQNTARLLQPIPVLYGRQKVIPDYAATPYTEIQNGDQYLYQLFAVSQGDISIEEILIGDTNISSYDGVQMEVIPPYQPVTLFPTNVDTSTEVASQELYGPNNSSFAVIGPFVSAPAATLTNYLAFDISIPSGLFTLDDLGNLKNATCSYQFEAQLISDAGTPIGQWFTVVTNSVTAANRDPIRLTHKVSVPNGRYQCRAQRTNNQSADARVSDVVYWDNMRAYMIAPTNYGGVTLLALAIKATNQLSTASSHQIGVIATRKLQTWDPVNGWSLTTVATQNPAWAAADILRNAVYGRNLPDSKYNLQKLYALAQTFTSRGDTFNYVFDTTITLWQALQLCCKVGRTIPVYYAGLIEFIRNEPQSVPTAMFQPQNMVKGSFQTTYQFADVDTPDYVTITFINQDTWQADSVDCILPGGTSNVQAVVDLPGVTNRQQAWREGITMAAINKLQRRIINFTTELEGYLPQYNDLIQISHDVPAWGYSGRVKSLDVNTGFVDCSEDFTFVPGETHVIAFRREDGSADGPYTVVASPRGIPNEVMIVGVTSAAMANIYISPNVLSEPTFYQFGPMGQAGLLANAYSASPQGDGTVSMQFVNYDPNIFAAETGGVIPNPGPVSNLPNPPSLPVIDKISLEYTYAVGQQTIVATPANGAQYYEFQVSPDGQTWIALGTSQDPQMNVALNVGNWYIRVRGIGLLKGPWTTIQENVEATTLPLVSVASFAATSIVFGVQLDWAVAANNGGIAKNIEIWHGLNTQLGNAVRLTVLPTSVSEYIHGNMGPGETHYYWARVIDQAGRAGPWYNNGTAISGQSSSDVTKIIDYLGGAIDETLLAKDLQTKVDNGQAAYVGVQATNNQLAAMYTIKTQLTVDGKTYIAGVGVGVQNNNGIVSSQVLVAASTFAILDPNTSNSAKFPFIVSGGVVYMNTAFIQNASITNAMIGGVIQSNQVNAQGQPAWSLDKNGVFTINGVGGGNDRMIIQNNQILVYDTNNVLRISMGLNI